MIGRRPAETRFFVLGAARATAALARHVRTSPLGCILAAQVALHLAGLTWGLPGSDGWDNDGVAPRDFLAGMVATVVPGQYFRYPPVHLALLTALTAPVTALALLRAPSLAAHDVVAAIVRAPTATALSVVARAVTVAMATGVVWALAKVAETVRGKAAGLWTAGVASVGVPLVYYGQTSNLDVPYMFWGCLALVAAVEAVSKGEPRLLRRAALLAALSIGTKDQAFALFLLSVPVALVLCVVGDPDSWLRRRETRREVLVALVSGGVVLLALEGPLYNPHGFARRVAYLAGPASVPFAPYSNDPWGRLDLAADVGLHVAAAYPLAFGVPVVVGVIGAIAAGRRDGRRLVVAMLPLLVTLSFTLAFNVVLRRADHRFVLPQSAMLAVYGGIGCDLIWGLRGPRWRRWLVRTAAVAAFVVAGFAAVDVDVNLLDDPRYEAEAWMRAHVGAADRVETYGMNAYLPRFPAGISVQRVGRDDPGARSPLPGVEEIQGALGAAPSRGARFLVVPEAWAGRFLRDPAPGPREGRVAAGSEIEASEDRDACDFLRALRADPASVGYRLAHTSAWDSRFWPAVDIHASTARTTWIYERQ